jgi:hypothetical protein
VLLILLIALSPITVRADVTGTATISVTVLPSPLDAAILPGCEFVVQASSRTALCNATLLVADPTLSMTGWRVTLAATGLTCDCQQSLPAELLTLQAVVGPTFVNGQPIDMKNGPIVESHSLGQALTAPVPITKSQPEYGNGAYSFTLVVHLAIPINATPGTYVPEWLIGVFPRPN